MNFVQKNIANVLLTACLYSINMIIGVFTSRLLGPAGIGHFQVFSTTQSIIATLFSLGLGQSSIYFINSKGYKKSEVVSTLVKFFIPLSIIVSIGFSSLIYSQQNYFGKSNIIAIILFSLGTSALLFTTSLRAILMADLRIAKIQAVQYISQILILISVILVYFFHLSISVDWLLALYAIAQISSALLLISFFSKYFRWTVGFDMGLFKKLAKLGVVMSANNIVQILFLNTPIYALTWLWSDGFTEVGYYSRAIAITTIATFTIQAIGPLLYAKLSKVPEEEKLYQTKISAIAFFVFNLIMLIGIQIFADMLVRLLYGVQFLPSVIYLRVISFSLFFNGMMVVALNVLSSKGLASRVLRALITGTVLLWISIFATAFMQNPIMIAYSVVISSAVTALILVYETTKVLQLSIWDYIPTKISQIKDVISIIKSGLK